MPRDVCGMVVSSFVRDLCEWTHSSGVAVVGQNFEGGRQRGEERDEWGYFRGGGGGAGGVLWHDDCARDALAESSVFPG